MFAQDSAPAHRACEMVEFLAREIPDFSPMLLIADTMNIFFISKPDLFYRRSRVATDSTG